MLQPGTIICAKYEILGEIGRGGMSVVYLAKDIVSGNKLAIKDVERNGGVNGQTVVQSLATEGRMLKQLNNEHLPHIYDVIEDAKSIMLVMDYIEGRSLDKILKENGPIPEAQIYQWSLQICSVLDYLHNQNPPIIYRDMKPANVMLQPNGNIMLIDFGTARTQKVGMAMTADTILIGTEGFAAPEQYGGMGESTPRTDVFCLGATIYNMLTGRNPSDKPRGIPDPSRWDPIYANSPLAGIIMKCVRPDPAERYQSAMELYNDLMLAQAGQPTSASGGFGDRKSAFQKQELKRSGGTSGLSGGLSGLLSKGRGKSDNLKQNGSGRLDRSGKLNEQQQQQYQQQYQQAGGSWQQTQGQALNVYQQANNWGGQQSMNQTNAVPPPGTDNLWRRIMIIAGIAAVVLLLIGLVLVVARLETVSYVLLIFAFAALILTGISAWLSFKNR